MNLERELTAEVERLTAEIEPRRAPFEHVARRIRRARRLRTVAAATTAAAMAAAIVVLVPSLNRDDRSPTAPAGKFPGKFPSDRIYSVGPDVDQPQHPRLLAFADATRGWAGRSAVFGTRDGGTTWTKQMDGDVRSIDAVDADHAWLVGPGGDLFATSDGSAWSRWRPAPNVKSLWSVDFADLTHGWVVASDGKLLGTDDGVSWFVVNTVADVRDACRIDERRGYVAVPGAVKGTMDGGHTWRATALFPANWVPSLRCSRPEYAWALGLGTAADHSLNGTYEVHFMPSVEDDSKLALRDRIRPSGKYFDSIDADAGPFAAAGDDAWFFGRCGACAPGEGRITLVRTSDGGSTWRRTTPVTLSGDEVTDVTFVDESRGWLLAVHEYRGRIYATSDGGTTWQLQLDSKVLYLCECS